jgi:hypothetical protein
LHVWTFTFVTFRPVLILAKQVAMAYGKFAVQSTSDSKQIAATDLDALQHHAGQNNIYRGVLKNLLTKPLEPANEHLLTG